MVRILRCIIAVACIVTGLALSQARADWRDDFRVLRLGVLTGDDAAYRVTSLEPFRVYLEERLAVPVEIVPAGSYAALIDAQASGMIQYAIHSATSYATAAQACQCVEPIAAPVAADGALGFYSILVVKADSPVRALADARDLRLAVAGEDSVAGRLIPYKAFAHDGIVPSKFFSAIVEMPDPEAALAAVLSGDADIAAGWSSLTGDAAAGYDFGALTRLVADGRLAMSEIRIVWQSALIPFGPHVVRSDLPAELKTLLSEALLSMAGVNPDALDAVDRLSFGGGGFAAPEPGLYEAVEELVAAPPANN